MFLEVGSEGSSRRRMTPVQVYLPIADLPVNIFLLFAMGIAVGFISGMFGIGGGFLMTPLLIFAGISPAVSVPLVPRHIASLSFSRVTAFLSPWAPHLTLAPILFF